MPTREAQLYISTGTIIRFFAVLFGIAAIYLVRDVLAALFFAVIVASAIEPAISWMIARRVPRILAVILLYLLLAMALFLIVYLIFPIIIDEFQHFYDTYPAIEKRLILELNRAGFLSFFSIFGGNAESLIRLPGEYLQNFGGGIFDFASTVFGGVTTFLFIVVFSFYLAAQEKGIERFLRLIVPLHHEPYVIDLWQRSQRKLGVWLRTQLLLGALIGVLLFFGLTLLQVKQAFILAIIAGLFEIIPVVGPILAAVPAVSIAVFVSPYTALLTILLYVVVQQVESESSQLLQSLDVVLVELDLLFQLSYLLALLNLLEHSVFDFFAFQRSNLGQVLVGLFLLLLKFFFVELKSLQVILY